MLNSSSEKVWSDALFDVARSRGFDSVLYAALPTKHATFETCFFHTNSQEWRERYDACELNHVDPIVLHCMSSALPLVWGAESQASVHSRAIQLDNRSGITFPMHGSNGEVGLISFATGALLRAQFSHRIMHYMADLSLVRDYAFESSFKFIRARNPAQKVLHLSKRQLEVLRWAMVGKSSWEISRIIGCVEATVNFHIANICEKFDVRTRQQALVKAIAFGIITPAKCHR